MARSRRRRWIVVLVVLLSNAWPACEATEGKSKNWPEIRQITKSQYLPNIADIMQSLVIAEYSGAISPYLLVREYIYAGGQLQLPAWCGVC